MKCPNCDKKLTDKRIRYARAKRKGGKIYCDNSCLQAHHAKRTIESHTCEECGEVKDYRIHTNIHGARRCKDCAEIEISNRRRDSEVKALVILNPGAGFDYFIDMVFSSSKRAKTAKAPIRWRLTEFLKEVGEYEGIDYMGWLQNADAMRIVNQDNIPAGFEKYARGQRRSIPSNHGRNKRIRKGLPTRQTGSTTVKIPPEFRWGKYKPL